MSNNKNNLLPTPPYKTDSSKNIISLLGENRISMFNLLNIRNSKRGFSISENRLPSPLTPPQVELKKGRGSKCAFTLAEVLITLVIIGVISAITVPTLITKYQKEQTVTRLKKAYSTLAQTTQRAIADNGPITTWELGAAHDSDAAKDFFNKYMKPYMSISTPVTTQADGGWKNEYYWLNNEQKNEPDYTVRTYLNDGSSITFRVQQNGSTTKSLTFNVDINGDKKPNKMGKDIFQFYYYIKSSDNSLNGKFVPTGYNKETREELLEGTYSCNKLEAGSYCTALIMKDGWRIADDYPW